MMGEIAYPTHRGIAVAPWELELPPSHLNPEREKNFNNHHNEWTAKMFGKYALYNTFRNLACMQFQLPVDVHQWLHDEYEPPRLPTPLQAVSFIEEQRDQGGLIQIKKDGHYIQKEIDDYIWSQAIRSYGALTH